MKKAMKNRIGIAAATFAVCLAGAGIAARNTAEVSAEGTATSTLTGYTIDAASIRYIADEDKGNGMRFLLTMNKTDYEAYAANGNAELGALMLPSDLLGEGEALTAKNAKAAKGVTLKSGDDAVNDWVENAEGKMENIVYLWNIPAADYDREVTVRGYAYDGSAYKYSENEYEKSVSAVAYALLGQEGQDDTVLNKFLKEYTVTFEGANADDQTVKYGGKAERPTDPTQTGSKFLGWYVGEEEFDFNTQIKGDVKLTAKWLEGVQTLEKIDDTYYGAVAALDTDLALGTSVEVTMDVYVASTSDQSKLGSADNFWSDNTSNNPVIILDHANINTNGWKTVKFVTHVIDNNVALINGSVKKEFAHSGNYAAVVFYNAYSSDTFAYKNVTVSATDKGHATVKNAYNEMNGAFAPIHTDLAAGTSVEVTMKVKVTSTSQHSVLCGTSGNFYDDKTVNGATTLLAHDNINTTDWTEVTFTSKVTNNTGFAYATKAGGTLYYAKWTVGGNWVGIYIANCASTDTLEYKDVKIEALYGMPAGNQKTLNANGYYSAVGALKTELAEGTQVTVTMDIYVTGTFDSYTAIYWVDTVWSTDGGERKECSSILTDSNGAAVALESGKWISVQFTATVRNFSALRGDSAYPVVDTSSYGNAVYINAHNFKTAESFTYKNVVITAKA